MSTSVPAPISAYAPGTFAHFTVERRLPKILADAKEALGERAQADERWSALESALLAGSELDPSSFSAITPFWERKLASLSGARWRDLSFFDLEFLFYRAIDSIASDLRPGFDVFAAARRAALAEAVPRVAKAVESMGATSPWNDVIAAALAGNEADLSQLSRPYAQTAGVILKDERLELCDMLEAARDASVVVLADNAGSELCLDLVLVDVLLDALAPVVEVQLKARPMFVSDALISDAEETIDAFCKWGARSALSQTGDRLRAALGNGRLILSAPTDWIEPRHMNALEPALAASLKAASLVLAKGDLNSRRFFEDRAWPADCPVSVASVAAGMRAFALRVLKSDCVVGLPSPLVARMSAAEPEWRSSGKYSVVQRLDRGASY